MGTKDNKVQGWLTVPTAAKKRPLQASHQELGESTTPWEQQKEGTVCVRERGWEAQQTGRASSET